MNDNSHQLERIAMALENLVRFATVALNPGLLINQRCQRCGRMDFAISAGLPDDCNCDQKNETP